MRFMNEHEIHDALHQWNWGDTPNRLRLAQTVSNLANWADNNSDGWAYWPKPARAANKAMELLSAIPDSLPYADATDAEVTAALRPIKAFLTRQGVPHADVLPSLETPEFTDSERDAAYDFENETWR